MEATSPTDTPPIMQGDLDACPYCGKLFDRSAITDSVINGYDLGRPGIYGGGAGHLHFHGVAVAARDALTVRGSLKRWANHARLRTRWHLRKWPKLRTALHL